MKKTILLWDIDGTLLDTNGAGVEPLTSAVNDILETSVNFIRSECAGLTDYQIIKHMVKDYCSQEVLDQNIGNIINLYNARLEKNLANNPAVGLNNIENKLYEISKVSSIDSHICTGNNILGAQMKLKSANLLKHFSQSKIFSAHNFSERSSIVNDAKKFFQNDIIFVIGDTHHDVKAAKSANIPVVIIASNNFALETSNIAQPDYILPFNWQVEDLMKIVTSA